MGTRSDLRLPASPADSIALCGWADEGRRCGEAAAGVYVTLMAPAPTLVTVAMGAACERHRSFVGSAMFEHAVADGIWIEDLSQVVPMVDEFLAQIEGGEEAVSVSIWASDSVAS